MHGGPGQVRLIAAGIAMVGMSFGLARYGYGLLLPEMRRSFDLSSAALGVIATGSYAAYLLATGALALAGHRAGPRLPLALGGLLAVVGMACIALAQTPAALAVGVLVAGAAAALAYPPFGDAVAAAVPRARQGRVLAMISAGTGWGVAAAVAIALVAGSQWRAAWVVFAVLAAAATVLALTTVRRSQVHPDGAAAPVPPLSWSWFVCPRSGPLLVGALLVGVGASVFWTFGPDFAAGDGPSRAAGPVLLGVVGVSSVLGSVAGDLLERVGGRLALSVSAFGLAASLCVLAVFHASWLGVVIAGLAFGATYNILLAVQAIWSGRVFAQRPATGLAAMLFMLGIGQLIGPPLAGALADGVGLAPAFYIGGALIAGAALLPPREELRARAPAGGPAVSTDGT